MREQIAEIIWEYEEPLKGQVTDQILNLFRAEVDKLTVIGSEDKVNELWGFSKGFRHSYENISKKLFEAQLQSDQKKLKEKLG